MAINLRDYQDQMIEALRVALRSFRNVLLQSPTGSGKTVLASFMLDSVKEKGNRGFFICHRRELIDQTAKTFDKFGIPYGFIAAGYPQNFYQPIQICSIDTLKNRLGKTPIPDFCIWDESHHIGAAGWDKVHKFFDKAYHVGLSATPERLDGKGLDKAFDTLVPGPQTAWLIEQGFLAKYKLFSVPGIDLNGVHSRMGDFVKSESEAAMDKPSITGDIVRQWKNNAYGRITIGFAMTVKYSMILVEKFNAAGIRAEHLDAKTPKEDRRKILRELATGKVQIVFNVGLFGEGYDLAANSGLDVAVGCVIDAAPTQSLSMWLQRCGRALRPQEDPAIILDHAGNFGRHGAPCRERSWSLEGRETNYRAASEDAAATDTVRQCSKCYFVEEPQPICSNCGHVHETGRKIKEVEGELLEIDVDQISAPK